MEEARSTPSLVNLDHHQHPSPDTRFPFSAPHIVKVAGPLLHQSVAPRSPQTPASGNDTWVAHAGVAGDNQQWSPQHLESSMSHLTLSGSHHDHISNSANRQRTRMTAPSNSDPDRYAINPSGLLPCSSGQYSPGPRTIPPDAFVTRVSTPISLGNYAYAVTPPTPHFRSPDTDLNLDAHSYLSCTQPDIWTYIQPVNVTHAHPGDSTFIDDHQLWPMTPLSHKTQPAQSTATYANFEIPFLSEYENAICDKLPNSTEDDGLMYMIDASTLYDETPPLDNRQLEPCDYTSKHGKVDHVSDFQPYDLNHADSSSFKVDTTNNTMFIDNTTIHVDTADNTMFTDNITINVDTTDNTVFIDNITPISSGDIDRPCVDYTGGTNPLELFGVNNNDLVSGFTGFSIDDFGVVPGRDSPSTAQGPIDSLCEPRSGNPGMDLALDYGMKSDHTDTSSSVLLMEGFSPRTLSTFLLASEDSQD